MRGHRSRWGRPWCMARRGSSSSARPRSAPGAGSAADGRRRSWRRSQPGSGVRRAGHRPGSWVCPSWWGLIVVRVPGLARRGRGNLPSRKNLPIGKIPEASPMPVHPGGTAPGLSHNGAMTDIRQFTNDSAARATTDKDPAPRAPRASRPLKEQGILAQAENHLSHFPSQAPAPRAPRASRLLKEQGILAQAENHFAQFGFEGASLESIAAAIGISRHKLLYYFPSKEALYQRVLDDVLTQWLASMHDISHSDDPQQALRRYIHAKLHYSRTRPQGAQVFAKEVIAGAP